jgi:hypothetical protein
LREHLALLAIERLDLRTVAVEQLQPQPGRRVVAPAAVTPRERRQAWLDRLVSGSCSRSSSGSSQSRYSTSPTRYWRPVRIDRRRLFHKASS